MEGLPLPFLFLAIIFLLIFAKTALRIICPYEKGLGERLGKYNRTEEPGLAYYSDAGNDKKSRY